MRIFVDHKEQGAFVLKRQQMDIVESSVQLSKNKKLSTKGNDNVPLVSVLMPVHKRPEHLREAIESILNQTYKNFEFLIVYDLPSDECVKISEEYKKTDERIRLIFNRKGKSICGALNTGLEEAQGKYIARMDSDDISLPHRLEKQLAYLKLRPEVGLLGSRVKVVDEKLDIISISPRPSTHVQNKWSLLFGTTIMHPSAMYRKDLALKLGGYTLDDTKPEDFELWSRLSEISQIHQLQEILVMVRKHDENRLNPHLKNTTISVSVENILKLNSQDLDCQKVQELVKWLQGVNGVVHKKNEICKTLLTVYFCFISQNRLSFEDRRWINVYFVNILTPALFKLRFLEQLSILFQTVKLGISFRRFDIFLYPYLIRKYIFSLLK